MSKIKQYTLLLNEEDVEYLKKMGIALSPITRHTLHTFVLDHQEKFGKNAPKEGIQNGVSN